MFSGGLYCSMRCPEVLSMMTLIRVARAPARPLNKCYRRVSCLGCWNQMPWFGLDNPMLIQREEACVTQPISTRSSDCYNALQTWDCFLCIKLENWQSGCRPCSCESISCWASIGCIERRACAIPCSQTARPPGHRQERQLNFFFLPFLVQNATTRIKGTHFNIYYSRIQIVCHGII